MKCPAQDSKVSSFGFIHYGMLVYFIGGLDTDSKEYSGCKKFPTLRYPSQKAYLCDSVWPDKGAKGFPDTDTSSPKENGFYYVYNNGKNLSRRRHGFAANIFFPDGHAANWKESTLKIAAGSNYWNTIMFGKIGLD